APGTKGTLRRRAPGRPPRTSRPAAAGEGGRRGTAPPPRAGESSPRQLREHRPEAFRAAHSRLFDHLCATTPHRPDTLPGLRPLYQAVTHGCLAGRQREACYKVYVDRILHGTGDHGLYSTNQLGAYVADLRAVAAFFAEPW